MTSFTDPTGYNKADAEFRERDAKLLREMRAKLDAQRAQTCAQQGGSSHWMRCPKCGSVMKEVDYQGVKIDQCQSCHGVFFDAGELDLLLAQDAHNRSLLTSLFGPRK